MIPNLIHRIWVDPDDTLQAPPLPAEVTLNLQSWQANEPQCVQRVWSLPELLRLCQVHDMPNVGRTFQACRFPSMKADIGRLLLLHVYGGFWADLKMFLLKPFLSRFKHHDLVTTEHFPKDDFPNPNGHLCIGFIGAAPSHPVITMALKTASENVNARKRDSIYHLTGATNLNNAVREVGNLGRYEMIAHEEAWKSLFDIRGGGSYTRPKMHWSEREQHESPYLC